jgi:hypothetical protein
MTGWTTQQRRGASWIALSVVAVVCLGGLLAARAAHAMTTSSCPDQAHRQMATMHDVADPLFAATAVRQQELISCDEGPTAAVIYLLEGTPTEDLAQRLRRAGWSHQRLADYQSATADKVFLMTSPDRSLHAAFGHRWSASGPGYSYVQIDESVTGGVWAWDLRD